MPGSYLCLKLVGTQSRELDVITLESTLDLSSALSAQILRQQLHVLV